MGKTKMNCRVQQGQEVYIHYYMFTDTFQLLIISISLTICNPPCAQFIIIIEYILPLNTILHYSLFAILVPSVTYKCFTGQKYTCLMSIL